jgi:hypothetical protein
MYQSLKQLILRIWVVIFLENQPCRVNFPGFLYQNITITRVSGSYASDWTTHLAQNPDHSIIDL